MTIYFTRENYSEKLLTSHSDKIFVFGDNICRRGKGGQAIIRDLHNTHGVSTKRLPSHGRDAYYSDKKAEWLITQADVVQLYILSLEKDVVFPIAGIGTGLAKLREKSPKIWKGLNDLLFDTFGFNMWSIEGNLEELK